MPPKKCPTCFFFLLLFFSWPFSSVHYTRDVTVCSTERRKRRLFGKWNEKKMYKKKNTVLETVFSAPRCPLRYGRRLWLLRAENELFVHRFPRGKLRTLLGLPCTYARNVRARACVKRLSAYRWLSDFDERREYLNSYIYLGNRGRFGRFRRRVGDGKSHRCARAHNK